MRLISHLSSLEVIESLERGLNDIKLPGEELLESLRENPRYMSFLAEGTPIDTNVVCILPTQKEKFLFILKYHCFIRSKDLSSTLILHHINNLTNPDYDQQRMIPLLINNLGETRLFIEESNFFSDNSLLSMLKEYSRQIRQLKVWYSVKYKHERPIKVPQRKRGYNDKGNSPDPRSSKLGTNYQIDPSYDDLLAYWRKQESIKTYTDTLQFLQGMMY